MKKKVEANANDWRLQAYSYLAEDWTSPWTGEFYLKGTRLTVATNIALTKKKELTISLPNASALLLNASALAFAGAREIRSRSGIDKTLHRTVSFPSDADAFDFLEGMISSIVLAFTALEAFVNESIPSDYLYVHNCKSDAAVETVNRDSIERNVRLDVKLTEILPDVFGCASPKGGRAWQGYRALKKTRDRIIHMKSEDRKSSGSDVDTVWKAILVSAAPHIAVKHIIDHFVTHMSEKPSWHVNYPDHAR